ncbi:MAG: BON domain-containing protein [Candidatus Binatia bacterium]
MGVVASEAERKAAERIVRSIKGVRKLETHLNVLKYGIR